MHVRATIVMALFVCGLLLAPCASSRSREAQSCARIYTQPYDQVWNAVETMVLKDMRCTVKKSDPAKGRLETEWVHLFDTDGAKRWMIEAELKKEKDGVRVFIDKRVELQDDVSRSIKRYRQEKRDTNEPRPSGWKKTDTDRSALDDLYRRIEQKLASGEQ